MTAIGPDKGLDATAVFDVAAGAEETIGVAVAAADGVAAALATGAAAGVTVTAFAGSP